MRLYDGDLNQFRVDVSNNKIADILAQKYQEFFNRPVGKSEYRSWENSLQFLKNVFDSASLYSNKIILEYKLPLTNRRIDAIIFGRGNGLDGLVILELKQWSNDGVHDCEEEGNIYVDMGGHSIRVSHPSLQVEGYYYGLKDNMAIFDEEPEIRLYPLVYCHNYSREKDRVLYQEKFKQIIKKCPLFSKEDYRDLGNYIKERLSEKPGVELFNRFLSSPLKPSKELIKHVGTMINKQQIFNLIDEQIPTRNTIISNAKRLAQSDKKYVIIVKGGPGTGKSVIALESMAELLRLGKQVFYITGSATFTKTLKSVVGSRAKDRFKYFFSFTHHKENEIDVLICDEAHRLRKNSKDYGVPANLKSDAPQVDDIIRPSRLSVFFLDEHQIVRPNEVGNVELIKESAKKFNAEIIEFELMTQFRCGGSETYMQWLDNTLDITPSDIWLLDKNEPIEFKIFDSPAALRDAIYQKNKEKQNSARIVAGFCWKWSPPRPDGTLVNDVKIGDFEMPWENKKNFWKWPTFPEGIEQVGTVYTSQGFEFDYIGVIVGDDFIYDRENKTWIGIPEKSHDPAAKRDKSKFTNHMKNVYRVLMSRAHKGVYVYFMNKSAEEFFKSRIRSA